jgi:hypothetical protein
LRDISVPKPDAIRSIRDIRAGINILIYGDNGVGKTPLIGSGSDTLILNCDPPESVLSARVAGSDADVWSIRDWSDAEEAHEYLRHSRHGYRWVWCDSITGMQVGGMDGIMEDLVAAKPHRDRYIPDMAQYLQNMNRLRTWVRNMSGLPFNFGITAHPFRWAQEDVEEEMIWPWVQGKGMPADICGFMNVIAFLRIRKVTGADKEVKTVQTLYSKDLPKYYARDRFSALPAVMNAPTIPKIEALIMEKVGGAVRDNPKTQVTKAGPGKVGPSPRRISPKPAAAKRIIPMKKGTTA